MQVFVNVLIYLFSSKKKLVYSTFSLEDYYAAVNRLQGRSVPYRVASFSQFSDVMAHTDQGNEYKIYVKKKDGHRAAEALSGRK